MQTALVCLCLCLLSTALSTPVPPPLPGRAAGNCVGQHRILLKGCNAKHGFYVFKYVYSFSTRRNQTQIKKEEADSQSAAPSRQLGDDKARQGPMEDRVAPEQGDNSSTDTMENGTGLKPENRSAPGTGRDAHSPRPGTGTRARGGVGVVGPTSASSEGSGDLDLVVEVDGGVSILPQGGRPREAVAGNMSTVRSEDRDDGSPSGVPVEGAMTTGRERAPATGGAGDEGSGEATIPGQGQEGIMRGTGTGGATLASVTEKTEDVQVDAEGVDEYAYIPDSGSVTVTHGKVGSTVRATRFTQISPDKDDKVNIFIGRANIHVGEQETTQAGATVGRKDDGMHAVGTSSPLPRLGVTAAHDSDDDDGIPARRQPEELTTTATLSHADSVTSSPGDGHPTGDDADAATAFGDGEGQGAPSPWRVVDGVTTIPKEAGIHGNSDDEAKGEGQRFDGRPGHLAVTTPHRVGDKEATAAVPAEGASIRGGTTMASPGVSEGDCTTAVGMASGRKAGESTIPGRGGSGEVGPATPQPHGEGWPRVGLRVRPGGAGLDKTPRMDKALSPRTKAVSRVSSGAQIRAGGRDSDAGGRPRTTEAGGSPPPPAGQARGSTAAVRGQERGRGDEAAVLGAGRGHLPRHHGRRPGSGGPGAFAALGHSRQVDEVKRADELHVRERAFYALGGAEGGPRGPYTSLGSADSSQSSEGEQGSHSDSRQTGLRPSGWGPPGHPHGHWSQGAL
ncbi:matrix extracellular phosphoglycoprotein [Aquila chrysaetos chrysaetos]|uniref:matrix extracellular phosphoglycoprotein n=1 Tax=Aquila chrysaetos chrysaetos TaxID=223781 RepID=UPI00117715A8|nr:matrix extracellular phosphoglycoprotein [Aquila chrysaetos chrysaetos]